MNRRRFLKTLGGAAVTAQPVSASTGWEVVYEEPLALVTHRQAALGELLAFQKWWNRYQSALAETIELGVKPPWVY